MRHAMRIQAMDRSLAATAAALEELSAPSQEVCMQCVFLPRCMHGTFVVGAIQYGTFVEDSFEL